MNVAVILLAAGGSTRLGSPKQLLTFQGCSLLRRAAAAALATGCRPVVAVLGAWAETLRAELTGSELTLVENPAWERGMGGSIQRGMEALDRALAGAEAGEPDGVLLSLCDQPLVGEEALGRLLTVFQAADRTAAVVAAAYDGTVGVPVVFGRTYFDALRNLPEEAGAKALLKQHAAIVTAVPLPEGAVDIDTREQYDRLTLLLE